MLEQLIQGQTDPTTLAEMAKARLREKRGLLEIALAGTFKPHQALGANYLDERNKEAVKRRAIQRLGQLGYQVELRSAVMACAA